MLCCKMDLGYLSLVDVFSLRIIKITMIVLDLMLMSYIHLFCLIFMIIS